MMYKVLNDIAPAYLKIYFSYAIDTSRYCLRSNSVNLSLPKPNADYVKKVSSFLELNYGIAYQFNWNLLPTLSSSKPALASQNSNLRSKINCNKVIHNLIKGKLNPKIKLFFFLKERLIKITVSYLSVFDPLLRFWDISVSLICKLHIWRSLCPMTYIGECYISLLL